MPDTSKLAGPVPVIADSPDVPRDFVALANALGPQLCPSFSSDTQRNTAKLTTAFKMCFVNGTLQIIDGTTWKSVGGAGFGYIDATRDSPGTNLLDGAWTLLGISGSEYSEGSGLLTHPSGVLISNTGLYSVKGRYLCPANAIGQRAIAIGTAAAKVDRLSANYRATTGGMWIPISEDLPLTAGTIVALWAYQDSGSTLVAGERHLKVRRMS